MVYTSASVSYLAISAVALLATGGAAIIGMAVAWRWRPGLTSEAKAELEKWAYLVTTITGIILYARLMALPLWFMTLDTLVPLVPGAMCLAGVHMAVCPLSFIATGAKFVVPMAYAGWIVMHALDRSSRVQPLFRANLFAITPVFLLLLAESAADMKVLMSIRAVSISCCTSVFDQPTDVLSRILVHADARWSIVLGTLCVLLLAASLVMRRHSNPVLCMTALAMVPAALVAYYILLQANLSPILLNAPFHHCVFCVWRDQLLSRLSIVFFTVSMWMLGAQAMLALASRKKDLRSVAGVPISSAGNWGSGLALLSVLLLLLNLVITIHGNR